MKKLGMGAGAALGLLVTAAGTNASAEDLALRRVLYTTGGVGYFEHEATVTGDATLSLDVRLDQVSDVLKSIIVFDEHGRLGQATLPGRSPLSEIFRDLPFKEADLSTPWALLRALRGNVVRMAVHGTRLEGRIVAVNDETTVLEGGRGTIVKHRVVLLGATGMHQALLEDAEGVEIVDAALRDKVERALAAIAEHGATERRTISIEIRGQGERKVRVGYVVSTPLWKATYRLVVPRQRGDAKLDGWALLENMSGQDFQGVDLTISSGNAVTFRQAIYEAYFVNRPEVPVDVFGRMVPPVDVGTVSRGPTAPPAAAPAPATERMMGFAGRAMHAAPAEAADLNAVGMAPTETAEATEGETQVLFHFPEPIDLPRGESLLVPIVSRTLPAARVSLYRRDLDPLHPFASVRMVNTGNTSLPPGAVSTYEEATPGGPLAFAGDARLGGVPAGEERFLSYALDLDVSVDRSEKDAQIVTGGRIVNGVLELQRKELRTTSYVIAGAKQEDRVVVIEEPRVPGFDLEAPTVGVLGATPKSHRIQVEVKAGQTAKVDVVLSRPIAESIVVGAASAEDLDVLVSAASLSDAVRTALAHVAELRRALATREQTVSTLESERGTLVADEDRLRKNLTAVPQGSELASRYLASLAAAEDRIGEIDRNLTAARAAVVQARKELADYVASLSL